MKIVISYDTIYVGVNSKSKRYGATVIKDGEHHVFHMAGTNAINGVPYGELRKEIKEKLNVDIGPLSKLQWYIGRGDGDWSVIDTEHPNAKPTLWTPQEKPGVYTIETNPVWKNAMDEVRDAFDARVKALRTS